MELTKWHLLSEQKPWKPGVYIVLSGEDEGWSYWCGERFHGAWSIPQDAVTAFNRRLVLTSFISVWRGLASDPSPKPSPTPAKPKRSGNTKVTRYVVIDVMKGEPVASFHTRDAAVDYAERMAWPRIKRVRHRSPE